MISYNGYEFSDRANVTIDVQTVYSSDGRTAVAKRLTIVVRDIVAPRIDTTVADKKNTVDMDTVKALLCVPGKELRLTEHGFGSDLIINGTNSTGNERIDIESGPKPQVLKWQPIGFERAANISWVCVAVISLCDTYEGIKSISYGLNFSINERGFTTRTVQGVLVVAQSQINGVSTASADEFRDRIVVEPLGNSHRQQSFNLSEDKASLSFTITDSEIESPNAYPAGVVSISAPTQASFKWPDRKATQTQARMNVSMELQAGVDRIRAFTIFAGLVNHRFGLYVEENKLYFLRELTISEDTYSNQYQFSVLVTSVFALNDQLRLMRFFLPIAQNWQPWALSMHNIERPRGLANIEHERTDENDPLVSLCSPLVGNLEIDHGDTITLPAPVTTESLCNPQPAPENSWVVYDAELVEATGYQRAHHTTYGESDITQVVFDPDASGDTEPLNQVDSTNYESCFSNAPPDQKWIWRGHAERIGYPIPPPGKIQINGKNATVVGQPMFTTRLLGYSFCQPVYEASWSIGLMVEETPGAFADEETDNANTIQEEETTGP